MSEQIKRVEALRIELESIPYASIRGDDRYRAALDALSALQRAQGMESHHFDARIKEIGEKVEELKKIANDLFSSPDEEHFPLKPERKETAVILPAFLDDQSLRGALKGKSAAEQHAILLERIIEAYPGLAASEKLTLEQQFRTLLPLYAGEWRGHSPSFSVAALRFKGLSETPEAFSHRFTVAKLGFNRQDYREIPSLQKIAEANEASLNEERSRFRKEVRDFMVFAKRFPKAALPMVEGIMISLAAFGENPLIEEFGEFLKELPVSKGGETPSKEELFRFEAFSESYPRSKLIPLQPKEGLRGANDFESRLSFLRTRFKPSFEILKSRSHAMDARYREEVELALLKASKEAVKAEELERGFFPTSWKEFGVRGTAALLYAGAASAAVAGSVVFAVFSTGIGVALLAPILAAVGSSVYLYIKADAYLSSLLRSKKRSEEIVKGVSTGDSLQASYLTHFFDYFKAKGLIPEIPVVKLSKEEQVEKRKALEILRERFLERVGTNEHSVDVLLTVYRDLYREYSYAGSAPVLAALRDFSEDRKSGLAFYLREALLERPESFWNSL